MTAMLHLPYADYKPAWPRTEADQLTESVSRILGLARVGYAASDSGNAVDLNRCGYEQLFETIATIAHEMFDPIDVVTKNAQLGLWGGKSTQTTLDPLYSEWKALRSAMDTEAATWGPDQDETGAYTQLREKADEIADRIASKEPQSHADAALILEWAETDSQGEFVDSNHVKARSNVIKFLASHASPAMAAE